MKLLVISFPCVTPINQQFYAEVEQQTGWELTIVTPAQWRNEYGMVLVPTRWHDFQGKLIELPVWFSGNIPLHIYRSNLAALIKEIQPDCIYVHHEPYAAATAQVYLANLLSLRCSIGFYSAQNILKSYPPPFRQTEQMVFRHSSFAFPVSHSVDQVLQAKGCQEKTTVLSLGIDPQIYFPQSQSPQLANSLRKTEEEVLVGYLGRISEEKGLKTLLHALAEIPQLPWRLIMVGAGDYQAELEGIAQQLNLTERITYIGFVPHPEAPVYLSAFDLLVLPSETRANWKEQFGRVIIEAIACGTPVVGSDSGEIPHLIKATGGGSIFPEAQPKALADQLRQLILDAHLRQQLADQGRQVVMQNYTNAAIAKRFIETIANL